MTTNPAKAALDALVSEVWEAALAHDPCTATSLGRKVNTFTRGDLAEAEGRAATARGHLAQLDRIDLSGLERTDRLTGAFVRHWLDSETREAERWWTGFGIAPYSGIWLSLIPRVLFPAIDLTDPVEAERYMSLVDQFADSVEAMRERVAAQAERGWRLPRPALATARKTLEGNASIAIAAIVPAEGRPVGEGVRAAVEAIVEARLKPAVARLLAAIGPEYEAVAPELVGMIHQPDGLAAYRLWVNYHLGVDVDPHELHQLGLDEVGLLAAEMERVRREQFGHEGDEASFHERLRQDPKAKAASAEALEAMYARHLDRMAPVYTRMFRKAPKSPGVVKRLPRELEAGMTFGYYQAPDEVGAEGVYYYSGNGIPDRMQINTAALIFHELVPGHHVHLSRQQENPLLPEIRSRLPVSTAFNEGWAEYASGLGEEAGLFDDPYDYYGFLVHQRFTAQRLVVDTGLNALNWTFDEAHAYMSANSLESAEQVTSELLRYATDFPGQALCYRWGCLKFRALRARAEAQLGPQFDLADFHEAILDQGCLPIPVLERSLDDWAQAQVRQGTSA